MKITHYINPGSYEGIAIRNQPVSQIYFHRPLSVIFKPFFKEGLMLDGLEEPVFRDEGRQSSDWNEIPREGLCFSRLLQLLKYYPPVVLARDKQFRQQYRLSSKP